MTFLPTAGEYARLARMHSSVLTGLTAVFGALAMNLAPDITILVGLFLMGLFVHVYGFVLNEYFDMEVDRHSKALAEKPLVSGRITPGNALLFCIVGAVCSYLVLLFILNFELSFWPLILLTLTLGIFYAYDRWGKRIVIADLLLAGFVGFLCLTGAAVIHWPLNIFAFTIAALAFLQLFLQNALADMKDVKHDRDAGASTTAIRLGVKIQGETSRFIIPAKFKCYILGVKALHIGIVFGFLYCYIPNFYTNSFQLSAIIIVVIFMLTLLFKIFSMQTFERKRLLRLIGAHELVTYALIPLLFIGILGILTVFLLIIFPVLWLACFLILMYGKLMPQI